MAMIPCPECKKSISEQARACPACGFTLTPQIVAAQKEKQKQEEKTGVIAVGVAFLLMVVLCSGILTCSHSSSSSYSSPSSSYSSLHSEFQYNDATDLHLKDLPGLRGFSDSEKEEIISAAKKFTHDVNELERQRGY